MRELLIQLQNKQYDLEMRIIILISSTDWLIERKIEVDCDEKEIRISYEIQLYII